MSEELCPHFRNDNGNQAGHCDNCGELQHTHSNPLQPEPTWADKVTIGETHLVSTTAWRSWRRHGSHAHIYRHDSFGNLWRLVSRQGRNKVLVVKHSAFSINAEKIDQVRREYATGRITQEVFEKTIIQLHNQDPR